MDKQIKDLQQINDISDNDKVIIQQMGGGTINTTIGQLSNLIISKIRDEFLIVKEEVLYTFDPYISGKDDKGNDIWVYANFDRTVYLPNGKKFTDYQYVEIYVRTDDGYIAMQKIHDPQPGKVITLTLGNIGSGAFFFVKCRCYTIQENYLTTTTFGSNQYMSGNWWYRGEKITGSTGKERMPGDFSEKIIGIAKIVGYK